MVVGLNFILRNWNIKNPLQFTWDFDIYRWPTWTIKSFWWVYLSTIFVERIWFFDWS